MVVKKMVWVPDAERVMVDEVVQPCSVSQSLLSRPSEQASDIDLLQNLSSDWEDEYAPFTDESESLSSEDILSIENRRSKTTKIIEARPDDRRVTVSSQPAKSNMEMHCNSTCTCERKLFAGKPPHYVEFFTPKISIICSCGKRSQKDGQKSQNNMYSLKYILRDWQVSFLSHQGICSADAFVRVAKKQAKRLAHSLFSWREEQGLPQFQIKSCLVAIHIWARACESVLKANPPPRNSPPTDASMAEYHELLSSFTSTKNIAGFTWP